MGDSNLRWLKDCTDVSMVGGKANALGEMLRAGFTVPNGFVLPVNVFKNMTPELEADIQRFFDELGATFVAVRSSAINEDGTDAAWAGQLDTFLNCTRENVVQSIERCWESADTDRAKSYAEQKGIKSTYVAVLIQEMIESDVSGVAFSANPVTKNIDQVVIEAGYGLGEAIVSGQITPDTYIVAKQDGKLIESYPGSQVKMLVRNKNGENIWKDVKDTSGSKLSDAQITEVCTRTQELEEYFKHPVDIEWAIQDSVLYILQCRPITTHI